MARSWSPETSGGFRRKTGNERGHRVRQSHPMKASMLPRLPNSKRRPGYSPLQSPKATLGPWPKSLACELNVGFETKKKAGGDRRDRPRLLAAGPGPFYCLETKSLHLFRSHLE